MVYVAAHYLTFLLFEGQAIFYLASDPFGQGWNLFGTANSAIDYGLLSQNAPGTCRSASSCSATSRRSMLAHDRALVLYPDAKLAVRSQYWMLGDHGRLHQPRAVAARSQAGTRLAVYAPRAPVTPSRVTRHGGD